MKDDIKWKKEKEIEFKKKNQWLIESRYNEGLESYRLHIPEHKRNFHNFGTLLNKASEFTGSLEYSEVLVTHLDVKEKFIQHYIVTPNRFRKIGRKISWKTY